MGTVLFVHPDRGWCERIKKEAQSFSGVKTLFFLSLTDAYEAIGNFALPIAAIYLSVKDQKSSVFAALEFCLAHRPATPLFLIDQSEEFFLRGLRVNGAFSVDSPFSELIRPLNQKALREDRGDEVRPMGVRQHPNYIPVPTLDFRHSLHYQDDVFIHHQDGGMKLFASRGSPVESGYLEQALKFSNWLNIREASCRDAREHLKTARNTYLDLRGISEAWIRSELLVEAKALLTGIRSGLPSDPMILKAISFLNSFSRYLSSLGKNPEAGRLEEFLREAGKTDRTLQNLSLALVLCGYFRFEKSAVVEILGIACILQDISLIHSPFGNIADLPQSKIPPEALNFFMRHPVHSADLLASATSLSATTLQVIRQHHETKDRKGFPNRIGGSQLHPMAEALSIMNQYLELREMGLPEGNLRERLKGEVYPRFSTEMVRALESTLNKIGEFP
jgi:hypothetical protein